MSYCDNPNLPSQAAQKECHAHTEHFQAEANARPSQERNPVIGIDLPFLKFGFDPREGSFKAALDVGLGYAEAKFGAQNGGKVGVDLGPLASGHVAAQAGVSQRGFNADGTARAGVLEVAGANGALHGGLGRYTGAGGEIEAYAGPADLKGDSHAYLSRYGVDATVGGEAGIDNFASGGGRGQFALGARDSQLGAGAGLKAGPDSLSGGAGIFSDGDRDLRPNIYIEGTNAMGYGRADLVAPANDIYQRAEAAPPAEAATAENVARYEQLARQQIVEQSTHVVKRGENFVDIMLQLRPDAQVQEIRAEADYLAHINHYRSADSHPQAGKRVATLNAEEIDYETRRAVAQHFGWPPPEA